MKRPLPPSSFVNAADERNHLHDLIAFLIEAGLESSEECDRAIRRFHSSLSEEVQNDGSIVLQEHRAFYFRCTNQWNLAARHGELEIELLLRLFAIGGAVDSINCDYLVARLTELRDSLDHANNMAGVLYVDHFIDSLRPNKAKMGIDTGSFVPTWQAIRPVQQ